MTQPLVVSTESRIPPRSPRKTRTTRAPQVERAAYTVDEFCAAYRISRAKLYDLWDEGKGPRAKRAGKWVIITKRDAEAWAAAA